MHPIDYSSACILLAQRGGEAFRVTRQGRKIPVACAEPQISGRRCRGVVSSLVPT